MRTRIGSGCTTERERRPFGPISLMRPLQSPIATAPVGLKVTPGAGCWQFCAPKPE